MLPCLTSGGRPVVRQLTIAAALAAVLAGCGDGGSSPSAARTAAPAASTATPAPSAAPASKAPVLVTLIQQRPGALIDKITVRTDGTGVFDRPSGGVGRVLRDVEVDQGAVERLRETLAAVPERVGKGRGELAANPATYIVRFDGRTVVARQGREPAASARRSACSQGCWSASTSPRWSTSAWAASPAART